MCRVTHKTCPQNSIVNPQINYPNNTGFNIGELFFPLFVSNEVMRMFEFQILVLGAVFMLLAFLRDCNGDGNGRSRDRFGDFLANSTPVA